MRFSLFSIHLRASRWSICLSHRLLCLKPAGSEIVLRGDAWRLDFELGDYFTGDLTGLCLEGLLFVSTFIGETEGDRLLLSACKPSSAIFSS